MTTRGIAICLTVFCGLVFSARNTSAEQERGAWRAGAAKLAITPRQPTWMAGYASRTKPSEGALHDIWAKALWLDDGRGHVAVLITLDVCGIGRDMALPTRKRLAAKHGLDLAAIVIACSHTHSGPVIGTNLITMYPLDAEQHERVAKYAAFLQTTIEQVVDQAKAAVGPVMIAGESGRADFAVNRRENKEPAVPEQRSKIALAGPVDHDVPVLRVTSTDGALRAVVFGYACHNTVLSINQISGDYAGFAQIAIERDHPGAIALFTSGCGGDQNPIPRREVGQAASYGEQLAKAVEQVLRQGGRPITGELSSRATEIPLKLADAHDKSFWEIEANSTDRFRAARAKALLHDLEANGRLQSTYPYPITIWKLGEQFTWIFLGGEVVVEYSLRLKRNLGSSRTWVTAYSNDVMAYIPSLKVLKEGGYEGATSMIYYGLPSPWAESVEEDIITVVSSLLKQF